MRLILVSLGLAAVSSTASAQRINLNFTDGSGYAGSSETSPATPGGPAGAWNNISLAAANTDVAVTYADGSPGPTLVMDTGRSENWTSSLSTQTADYTGSGAVYDVENLYEAGLINANNSTLAYRLKGLTPGTYAVHVVPMCRGYDAAGTTYLPGIHLVIGTGNDTDVRDSGNYTLVTTEASPEQNIDTSLTSWVAATDGSTPYNYVTAIVTIDSTSRWLTFLFEDGADPDRPGPAAIQIESANGQPQSVPVITEMLLDQQGLILRGSNGPASSLYQVLATTNLALPLYSWEGISTNQFDGNGDFDSTNVVTPGLGCQFYRLLLGSELPPGPTGPSILTGPLSQAIVLNQEASFSVLANGTPPLSYQWFFNSTTLLPGATNDTLTISNVQTTNAGTYSVTVMNDFGSESSSNALLTVLLPPAITDHPTNLTVAAGQPAAFVVSATGSDPLSYQWYFNASTLLPGATNATFSIPGSSATDAGDYSVVVSNPAGSATSLVATLTVHSTPVITTQPASQTVVQGGTALFNVEAAGSEPLHYQWLFNTSNLIAGATGSSLSITNAGTNNIGAYSVFITNSLGTATSAVATLTVLDSLPDTAFNLYGFGESTTGGGLIAEDSAGWVKVYTPLDFATVIADKSGTTKVIEIMNDLDLGWNEVGTDVQAYSVFREHTVPILHPTLIQTGVSRIDVQKKYGLTIFSANGATIRHGSLNVKDSSNIIIRNLKFDELWEWDESSKGDYDRNDWDFITLGDGGGTVSNVWIDHCTFTKSYDGVVDIKGGAYNITFSWNKYTGDDGTTNPDSFVWKQINALEANSASHPMYHFLRTHGFSTTNIVTIEQGMHKTHLIGATELNPENALHRVTFHHQWYINPWDRLPRLRSGNVHNYNIYVDDTEALAAKRLRNTLAATLSAADQNTLNNNYKFTPFLNGSISTEDGAVLVENSVYIDNLTPLRNNQTDPSDPVYTGKIMALDSIYQFHNTDLSTTFYRGSSTNAPGNTLFGPVQAPIKPFSWNGFITLPYSYPMDDPANLESALQSGAGAGLLSWPKTNWLKTAY